MKFDYALLVCLVAISNALPQPHITGANEEVAVRERSLDYSPADTQNLFKRKGGGGAGGRGGGTTSGGSTSSGSSSGSTSGSSSGSSSSGSRPAGSSTSSSGGRTSGGSGVAPAYGGGRSYAGGATVPYTAGGRSPSGITPRLLPLTALAIFPGIWLYGAYAYPYSHPYNFRNSSTNQNETKPVTCLCQEYQVCGCDENSNATYIDDLIGNGSTADLDSMVAVADVNGTSTILVNGTLANGTTADTASFGAKGVKMALEMSGYWVMAAFVAATVMIV